MKYHYYRHHPHYPYHPYPHHYPHYQYHQQNHHDMKREIDIVKPLVEQQVSPPIVEPQVSMPIEQPVESQVTPIQHEEYQNTIRFLQAKNAELSRVITTKPVKSSTKVVPRGSKQSFKIMADKHPMTDGSHNVLSEPTDASNNPVKSRYFNPGFGYGYPGFGYHYPGYLDGYGYGYPGYLGGYGYGHHYLGGYASD